MVLVLFDSDEEVPELIEDEVELDSELGSADSADSDAEVDADDD